MSGALSAPPRHLGPCGLSYNETRKVWRAECLVFETAVELSDRPTRCPYCTRPYQRDREAQLHRTRG